MPRPKQTVSIFSLAEEFQVSAPTISKALSNSNEVSEALRARVRDRAAVLGFKPTRPRRKTFNICVVLDQAESNRFSLAGYHEAVVEGVYDFCRENGTEFSIFAQSADKLEEASLTRELYARNADAAVVIGGSSVRGYFKDLAKNRMPFSCVFDGPPENTLLVDNKAVGRLAFEHLYRLRHRKIAFTRQLNRRNASVDRFMGFMAAAEDAGLSVENIYELIPPGRVARHEWGRSVLRDWIEGKRPWTAVFCLQENVATGVLTEASLRGTSIPGELSVLTCDDLVATRQSAPPLSVVDIPNHQTGYLAAERVWKVLKGGGKRKKADDPLSLPVERLIERESTGVCPSGKRSGS